MSCARWVPRRKLRRARFGSVSAGTRPQPTSIIWSRLGARSTAVPAGAARAARDRSARVNTARVYLDYQATTPADPRVVAAMLPYFTEKFGNPHSTSHRFGREAATAVEEARGDRPAYGAGLGDGGEQRDRNHP